MKTILEVLDCGNGEVRFNTDFKIARNPSCIPELLSKIAFNMTTRLWGGNEADVLAIIRLLAVSDLSVSVNRKEMIKMLDQESASFGSIFRKAAREMESDGKMHTIYPGVTPPHKAS